MIPSLFENHVVAGDCLTSQVELDELFKRFHALDGDPEELKAGRSLGLRRIWLLIIEAHVSGAQMIPSTVGLSRVNRKRTM